MPRKGNCKRRTVYWWNEEIATLRKECISRRRTNTRSTKPETQRANTEENKKSYKEAKMNLRNAINESKEERWKSLCKEIDDDVWGSGYKIATKRLRQTPPETIPIHRMRKIVTELFPVHKEVNWNPPIPTEAAEFMKEKLAVACRNIQTKKAPGSDGIPPQVIKTVAEEMSELVLATIYSTDPCACWTPPVNCSSS